MRMVPRGLGRQIGMTLCGHSCAEVSETVFARDAVRFLFDSADLVIIGMLTLGKMRMRAVDHSTARSIRSSEQSEH